MSKQIAFFDFDGTLTKKDTFLEFLKFQHGMLGFLWGFAINAPYLVAMKLGVYPNWKAKEKILSHFLKGAPEEDLKRKAESFCLNELPQLMRKTGLKQLHEHIKNGDKVYIVSASASLWVAPWCKNQGIGLISTELEVDKALFTGKIAGKNCYGPEKVNRINEAVDLVKYEHIYAYGDSSGDKEMLAIADKPFFRYFND